MSCSHFKFFSLQVAPILQEMSCFFEHCNHKFRSTIGKSKLIKNGEKVLLGCSGGRKSAALLSMTQQTLGSLSLKQITFKAGVLLINDAFLVPDIKDEQAEILAIIDILKQSGIDILYSSLEMVLRINTQEEFYWSSENINSNTMESCPILRRKIMDSMSDLTISAKFDFIKHLRMLLMTEIASHAGYSYLFVGDSATSLAGELLCDIALGRGSQISPDTSFYDTRYKVPVCRPIREFLDKEIALFNHLKNTPYKVLPNLLTKTKSNGSIHRLTEAFITNLQEDFPATIFTIFRTGGKLLEFRSTQETNTCLLCKSELDNVEPEACSALEALSLSDRISQPRQSNLQSTGNTDKENYEGRSDFVLLCHGCSNSFKKLIAKENFYHVISRQPVKRDKMKNEIKDFLLDDEEVS
ncbi:cytoplasmic tRNA 2-thiolation protein 2-like isoform X2 [Uloborus diversus]|uniref:cytoplasmic tRNA 2-thiolation protein 2-like isoform X2 n=2 Tax=Uloborus diversus TaxID=327109 RepID=UPI002408F97D|nr:cytoplasmic tRNA 2-thiolation protein 2-like isoform X2 [Uloborus diversus]